MKDQCDEEGFKEQHLEKKAQQEEETQQKQHPDKPDFLLGTTRTRAHWMVWWIQSGTSFLLIYVGALHLKDFHSIKTWPLWELIYKGITFWWLLFGTCCWRPSLWDPEKPFRAKFYYFLANYVYHSFFGMFLGVAAWILPHFLLLEHDSFVRATDTASCPQGSCYMSLYMAFANLQGLAVLFRPSWLFPGLEATNNTKHPNDNTRTTTTKVSEPK